MISIRRIITKLRHQYLVKTGGLQHMKKDISCNTEWYGNEYGGFFIHPNVLNANSIVYSFGIGEDISFDNAVIERHGCKVFGFDPTPKSIKWMRSQKLSPQFQFKEFGLSDRNESVDFYMPRNPDHVSGSIVEHKNVSHDDKVSVPMKNLATIISDESHTRIDVLKMDIEGAEYKVIENILDTDVAINQILIEFHDRFFIDGHERTKRAVNLLREKGFCLFAVSNSFEELSFIRREIVDLQIKNA